MRMQVVLAPHFYCPGVSGETRAQCYAGAGQWQGFDNTVGYLTVAPGYCSNNGTCKVRCPARACMCASLVSLGARDRQYKALQGYRAAEHAAEMHVVPPC